MVNRTQQNQVLKAPEFDVNQWIDGLCRFQF